MPVGRELTAVVSQRRDFPGVPNECVWRRPVVTDRNGLQWLSSPSAERLL